MVFGMGFIEWMALIGGYPTILSTFFLMAVLGYAGTRAIYRHRDYSNTKFHIRETLRYEEQIKELLATTKIITRWRFKQLVGKHTYAELTYIETAPSSLSFKERFIEWRIRRTVKKVMSPKYRRRNAKNNKKLRNTHR